MDFSSNEYVQSVEADDPDLPLDSPDPEYIRGIEVGMMLQSAIMGFPIHIKTHIDNAEMIMRIADLYEMTFSAEDAESEDMVIVSLMPPEDDEGDYYDEDFE